MCPCVFVSVYVCASVLGRFVCACVPVFVTFVCICLCFECLYLCIFVCLCISVCFVCDCVCVCQCLCVILWYKNKGNDCFSSVCMRAWVSVSSICQFMILHLNLRSMRKNNGVYCNIHTCVRSGV